MSSFRGRGRCRFKGPPGLFTRSDAGEAKHAVREKAQPSGTECPVTQEPSANECFVCCREIKVFAVGFCDHPVCHVCSTRLRALCKTNECPGCRAVIDEVFFVAECSTFENIKKMQFSLKDETMGIFFENDEHFKMYEELLTNKCNECVRRALISERSGERSHPPERYESFEALREHVQRDHKRHFCDLCVEHLKLFTSERQSYSKTDLRRHLKDGDLNDKSHKGHPRCDFCNKHYLDKDELYKHLKMDHFLCFICQKDNSTSRLRQYYATYDDLRQHFMRDHFLCEQGDCASEGFKAFATKLEYKAHTATSHSESLSREEQRAARDLAEDFAIPCSTRESYRRDGEGATFRRGNRENPRGRFGSGRERGRRNSPEPEMALNEENWLVPSVDTTSTKDFPSLLGGGSAVSRPLIPTPQYGNRRATPQNSADQFPSLGKPTQAALSTSATWFKPIRNGTVSSASWSAVNRTPSSPVESTSKPVNQAKPQAELFPTLPKSGCESDFGKVLKPIPIKKKQQKTALKTAAAAAKERKPLFASDFSVQITKESAKPNQQKSDVDFKLVTKNPTTSKSSHSMASADTRLAENRSHTKNSFELLDEFDLNNSGASWAAGATNEQRKTPKDIQKQPHSARPKMPKDEEFPSLGPAHVALGSAGLRPMRAKYKGVKPGELGQDYRSKDQFIQPPNFTKRTTEFMGMIKLLFNGSPERVTEYRLAMTNFRKGIISGEEFVFNCTQLFDDVCEFAKVFVEMVCLLPDIEKQNELILLYDNLKSDGGSQRKSSARDWTRCSECGQITIPEDMQFHQKAH